jgi:hypothetical protein
VLLTPDRHETLGDGRFTEAAARKAISRIASRAEQELDPAIGLWPRHPTDAMRPGEGPAGSLYWGAAGVAWALDELAAGAYVAQGVVDRELVEALEARLSGNPEDPDFGEEGVWFGVAGVLAVAEHRWPDASRRDRLADLARTRAHDGAPRAHAAGCTAPRQNGGKALGGNLVRRRGAAVR